jgi:hypothetical protein
MGSVFEALMAASASGESRCNLPSKGAVNSSGNKKSLPYPETTSTKIRIVRIKLPDYSIDAFAIERAPNRTTFCEFISFGLSS